MFKIGITGGIGSGKSLVCKIFEQLGVAVYNADDSATRIFDHADIQEKLLQVFGANFLDDQNKIDRKKLSVLVFSNKDKLEKLNTIIHPAVAKDFEQWCTLQSDKKYILKEAAILFESGAHKTLHKIITVTSPVELRIQRVMKREGWERAEVERRIENQLGDKERISRSDYTLCNDEQQLLIPQVLELHKTLSTLE